jgi:hypothetical protein
LLLLIAALFASAFMKFSAISTSSSNTR